MTNRSETAELTVYYDGSCPLCTAEIGHYETREGADQLTFVNVAEPEADMGADLASSAAMARFHVRKADGTLLSGAAAFIEIWRTLPGWRWLAQVARIPGVPLLMEGAYRLFLPVRPTLSRIAIRLGARPRTGPLLDKENDPA
ncbi:MAG: DUF393 domain-containing protein [Pseudomonadota bacterium]